MKARSIVLFCIFFTTIYAQTTLFNKVADVIPDDLPIPKITISKNPFNGYIFASVPYWGKGNSYLVIYDGNGKPVYFKKQKATCTDFKMQPNGLITYFDYSTKKFYALDSTMAVVDSFWVKNGYVTDEHDLKILKNGNALLIGLDYRLVDMSKYVAGGNTNASVVFNVIQEFDRNKNLVFEWKSEEHYQYTDAGRGVNLLDQSFVHTHINSVDVDTDGNYIISARNLNEITKIERPTGKILWRFGGKNNQFKFLNDTLEFSAQHSVTVMQNGNLLVFDNGLERSPKYSRVIEYKVYDNPKTATAIWSYKNNPDITSIFWGNAQRLSNGNTFISWGMSNIAATEVTPSNEKVFEMEFPNEVYSYRIFKTDLNVNRFVSVETDKNLPDEFRLEQNYPNPFNPTTIISYQIPRPSEVVIKVFDILGRDVKTIVREVKTAGNYSLVFDGSDLTSGVYFYQIKTEKYNLVKKMLLIK